MKNIIWIRWLSMIVLMYVSFLILNIIGLVIMISNGIVVNNDGWSRCILGPFISLFPWLIFFAINPRWKILYISLFFLLACLICNISDNSLESGDLCWEVFMDACCIFLALYLETEKYVKLDQRIFIAVFSFVQLAVCFFISAFIWNKIHRKLRQKNRRTELYMDTDFTNSLTG